MRDDARTHAPAPAFTPTFAVRAVDAYEHGQIGAEGLTGAEITGAPVGNTKVIEPKPYFHEWATVLPGMICLSRKARNATFRNYVAAETATPVIGCAAGLKAADAKNFYFAGICRSKTVRPIDDGTGPSVDEFFTLHIGGMVTMLNNSNEPVFPGDMLEYAASAPAPFPNPRSRRALAAGGRSPRRRWMATTWTTTTTAASA